jgi:UDP-glucose 4-epimerase
MNMLKHLAANLETPQRIVVLGSQGFVGRVLIDRLRRGGIEVLALGRTDIDLAADEAGAVLAARLDPRDSLVVLSTITPDKSRGTDAFLANVRIGAAICDAIQSTPPRHVVYASSDAVYRFQPGPTHEESCAEPSGLYGTAHLAREIMLQSAGVAPVAVLRPTLIYGAGDTHNSYGANRFRRSARSEDRIVLFGEGEETRDHIFVEDVAALIELTLRHRSQGILNLATGRSVSFAELAELVAGLFSRDIEIVTQPRQMAVTHRRFDIDNLRQAFPDFEMTPLEAGLAACHRETV